MLSIFPDLFTYSMVAPFILRVAVALACFRIGWHKKHDWSGRHLLKMVIILGGLSLLLGFLVQPISLVLILAFLILYKQEAHMDFLLLTAMLLALLFLGPGFLAIDLPL